MPLPFTATNGHKTVIVNYGDNLDQKTNELADLFGGISMELFVQAMCIYIYKYFQINKNLSEELTTNLISAFHGKLAPVDIEKKV